jgi:hypothetical protein
MTLYKNKRDTAPLSILMYQYYASEHKSIDGCRIMDIIEGIRYVPAISYNATQILCESIKTVVKQDLGEHLSNVLVQRICKQSGLSEEELLTNCDLFEKSLYNILGDTGAGLILGRIKHDILLHAVLQNGSTLTEDEIKNPNLSLNDIMEDITRSQFFEFIREIRPHDHVTLLYSNEDSKQRALSAFFNPSAKEKTVKGLVSRKLLGHTDFKLDSNVLYDELFSNAEKSEIPKRRLDWIQSLHSSQSSSQISADTFHPGREGQWEQQLQTRIAGEDCTWFFNNNLGDGSLSAEKSLGRRIRDNISVLCMYNISNIEEEQTIKDLVTCHSHVILDWPFMVYTAANV